MWPRDPSHVCLSLCAVSKVLLPPWGGGADGGRPAVVAFHTEIGG